MAFASSREFIGRVSGRDANTYGGDTDQRSGIGVRLAYGFRFVSKLLRGASGAMRHVASRFRVTADFPRLVFCAFAKVVTWLQTGAPGAVEASNDVSPFKRDEDAHSVPTLCVRRRLSNTGGTTFHFEISPVMSYQREVAQRGTPAITARALRQRKVRFTDYAFSAAGNRSSRRRAAPSKTHLEGFARQPRESLSGADGRQLLGTLLYGCEELGQYFSMHASRMPKPEPQAYRKFSPTAGTVDSCQSPGHICRGLQRGEIGSSLRCTFTVENESSASRKARPRGPQR